MGAHLSVRFVVLFLLMSGIAQLCLCGNSTIGCIQAEREALLNFKASFNASFNDPLSHPLLSTWNGNDCCQWEGISCNNVTGHVISLNLSHPCYLPWEFPFRYYIDNEFEVHSQYEDCMRSYMLEAQNLDSSILKLKHLTHLDLSRILFNYSPIPTFLGSMTQLTNLSLSYSGFSGRIPHSLGNLTNLIHLDFSDNWFCDKNLYADEVNWISQLSSLQHLDMSGVDLGKANNLFQVLNLLPSLSQIHLRHCDLANSSFLHILTNLTKIEVLDLSSNTLQAPFLDIFQNMTSISVLHLSDTHLDSLPLWLAFHDFCTCIEFCVLWNNCWNIFFA